MADESYLVSTHSEIASTFDQLSLGPWLVTAYNLGYAIALPTYGRLCDIYGHKSTLLTAYSLFTIGCAILGMAPSIWVAMAGRLIAGMGGSGMVDLISVIIADMAPLNEVAMYRSYISIVLTLGVSSGAPLGGIMADLIGWRWSSAIQVPLALICSIMAAMRLPSGAGKKKAEGECALTFDVAGMVFLSVTITVLMLLCLSVGGEDASAGSNPVITIVLGVVLILSGVTFTVNEVFWANDPLIPFWLMKTRGIGLVFLSQIFILASQFGLISNLSDLFIRAGNASNALGGLYLLPSPFGCTVGALLSGRLVKQTGKYKRVGIFSFAIGMFAYFVIIIRWNLGLKTWELMIYTFISGAAMGGLLSTQFVGLTAAAPKPQSATAITVYYLSQQMGIILGVTAAATMCRQSFANNLSQHLDTNHEITQKILSDSRFANTLPESVQAIVRMSFWKSFQFVPIFCLSTLTLALPLAIYLPEWPIQA
ncbi:major facilitator superfamily domain-containing protein [Aspergillus sergii]|uniref:Major facilitator superfamily domain-containing protein n=1 Tax=Aspergillus sergii TaxID=1034303 RepID=A0A5N6XIJ0_9EURO|nr:major facilitator superfamily domain-containing protein [Aspergillus sergii]